MAEASAVLVVKIDTEEAVRELEAAASRFDIMRRLAELEFALRDVETREEKLAQRIARLEDQSPAGS